MFHCWSMAPYPFSILHNFGRLRSYRSRAHAVIIIIIILKIVSPISTNPTPSQNFEKTSTSNVWLDAEIMLHTKHAPRPYTMAFFRPNVSVKKPAPADKTIIPEISEELIFVTKVTQKNFSW